MRLRFQLVGFEHLADDLPLGAFQRLLERPAGDRLDVDVARRSSAAAGRPTPITLSLPKQHGPLDHVLQLADVARPAIALQARSWPRR